MLKTNLVYAILIINGAWRRVKLPIPKELLHYKELAVKNIHS